MKNLNDFISILEQKNELVRIKSEVSTYLEITEIHKRTLEQAGPALLFENVVGRNGEKYNYPVLVNLFGKRERILLGLNRTEQEYKELGEMLALMRYPKPVTSLKTAKIYLPVLKRLLAMKPKIVSKAEAQTNVFTKNDINLYDLPIQWCWPNEPAPLITWGLVVTKGSSKEADYDKNLNPEELSDQEDYNLGIYRLQVLAKDKLIMRWLHTRGGAMHFKAWKAKHPNQDMPVAIAIGADPALILAGVIPLPSDLSEYKFAGLLRGEKTKLVKAKTSDLLVPANAEIVIEGVVSASEVAEEGPYGDHTGFYNSVETFPVVKVTAITTNKKPVYLSTYTGRPPDEPAILSLTLNDIFTPLIKQQFPEIEDFYLIPEACSYRTAVVSIKKNYPGQSKKVAFGIWSYLNQFMYTKFIIVIDSDLNPRDHKDVTWAISTNVDPVRDVNIITNTPMDYLDFSSEKEYLASKMLIDATTKIGSETNREWGTKIKMQQDIIDLVNKKWSSFNIF
ncbi:UbiD family decarboxylase [Rickettsiales bacterium LUAb2]